MQRDQALAVIEREASRILEIAAHPGIGYAAKVPTCPGWTLADLLDHLGRVYTMVTTTVSDPAGEPPDRDRIPRRRDSEDPAGWMRERLDLLLATLAEIGEGQLRWNFVNGPASPVAFWWRRQAHETLIHRVDAELAGEVPVGETDAKVALDGIAEHLFLLGFQETRPKESSGTAGMTIHLHTTDAPSGESNIGEWGIDYEQCTYAKAHLKAAVALRGPAWSLNRWLWRRGSAAAGPAAPGLFLPGLEVFGDVRAAEGWRRSF